MSFYSQKYALEPERIDAAVDFLGGADVFWEDLRFPLVGRNLDTISGRLDYNYYNGTVVFADNALFRLQETVSFIVQLPHAWKESSELRPHIHWLQQSANEPNWLLGYQIRKKGEASAIETDFTNHTLLTKSSNAFAYSSGVLEQITNFPLIDMTGCTVSDILHVCLWRDSNNDSSEFTGADPSALDEHVREFDIHYQLNSPGSTSEFIK